MMTELPSSGITLLHNRFPSNEAKTKKQIIQLDLVESVTKQILKSLRNNEQIRLKLGKKPTIQYSSGQKPTDLNHSDARCYTDVFSGPFDGTKPLYFSGALGHSLEVQKAKDDTAKTDEARATLENTLKSMQELRASNEASLVQGDASAPKGREFGRRDLKAPALNGGRFLPSAPSSPFPLAARSPGPTSAPSLSASASKDKIRLDAMRVPIVHLLAIGPMTTAAVARALNAPKNECEKALDKVALEVSGQRKLKEKCYKELNVWKFPYKSNDDRQKAIDHAKNVYDRLRVEKNDQIWQLLLPEEQRGQGISLSKFHFDKQLAPPKPTNPPDKDGKTEISDREGRPKKPKPVKDIVPKKKASEDLPLKPKTTKAEKLAQRHAKKESRFKSLERIEDSDEEAGLTSKPTIRTSLPITKVKEHHDGTPISKPIPSKQPQHKSKVSESSSSSIDLDRSRRLPERDTLKVRPKSDMVPAKKSPKPRHENAIQQHKPSVMDSSPPTHSTDAEDSSKGSAQSSAPSSPPSSNDIPFARQRRTYSPVVVSKQKLQQPSPPKRKAEKSDDEPPMKKQQFNGDQINSLPKSLTSALQHPTPERRSSGSSTSSPGKMRKNKQEVITEAKNFTSYYGRYRELHEKLSRKSSQEREDRELDQLWKMHKRLEEMKAEIWLNWDKACGGD